MSNLVLKDKFDEIFNNISKNMFIGFEDYFKDSNELMKLSHRCTLNFPPYNVYKKIVKIADDNCAGEEEHTFIELACAGIKKENLKVILSPDNILTIKTHFEETKKSDAKYVHQGIARREFSFSRTLQPNMKVVKVTYENGILLVELKNQKPYSENVEIEIE